MSKCLLCNSSKQDPRCGDFIQRGKIVVHEFCLYLSSALLTNGKENNGLYGFLPQDIYAESRRTSRLDCTYCHRPYANIGCCKSKCQRSFHTLCGIENGCENQFIGTFRSYCDRHVHKQLRKVPPLNEICCICYDTLRDTPNSTQSKKVPCVNYIEAPCCKNGWFHKQCLQGFARSAGYFFKCPLCNDTKKFKDEMPYRGIFVPERDAAWELEPNAFAELLERPSKCEAEYCKHKEGRNSCEDPNDPLLYCKICGAVAVHQNCLTGGRSDFICLDCSNITEGLRNNEDSGRESLPTANQHEDNNQEIDVCAISDSDDDSDFLENFVVKCTRRPIISESSDMEKPTMSGCKARPVSSRNKRMSPTNDEKRFQYSSNDDSDDSKDFPIEQGKLKPKSPKVCNTTDSDDTVYCRRLGRKKNASRVIDLTDESSEDCINVKRRKNFSLVIDSTDEDSDDVPSSTVALAAKRQRMLHNEAERSQQHTSRTYRSNSKTARKPFNNVNSLSPSFSKNMNTNDSYQHFRTDLNSNNVGNNNENQANIISIANRKRRKSICNKKPLNNNLQSRCEESDSSSTTSNDKKRRTSSSSSSTDSSLGYSSTVSSFSSTTSSTPSKFSSTDENFAAPAVTRRLRQQTLSSSSQSSEVDSNTGISNTDSNSNINPLDISCIANRTRRRKSNASITDSNSDMNVLDVSCIAKRTRRRKSIYCDQSKSIK